MPRHASIHVDLDAIRSNTAAISEMVTPAKVCAVVKADGYGHGAVPVARAALDGGADWLAVALPEEGVALRSAGIDVPVLLLSEPQAEGMDEAVSTGLIPSVYTAEGVNSARVASLRRQAGAAGSAAAGSGAAGSGAGPLAVHLKIDTGMHRVGVSAEDALDLARRIEDLDELALGGVFTHLAVADELDRVETSHQLELFTDVIAAFRAANIGVGMVHACNSAGAIGHPSARMDMVRVGISIYGYSPFGRVGDAVVSLRPALSVHSEVTMVRRLRAGDGLSYGLRHRLDRDATVAVVPLGYADGIDRRLGLAGGEVLIRGVRHRIRGVVTMDQMIVEVAAGTSVEPGDEVVLIGSQDDETVTAQEWADLLDTIPYEVLCRFGPRLPRVYEASSGPGDSSHVSRLST